MAKKKEQLTGNPEVSVTLGPKLSETMSPEELAKREPGSLLPTRTAPQSNAPETTAGPRLEALRHLAGGSAAVNQNNMDFQQQAKQAESQMLLARANQITQGESGRVPQVNELNPNNPNIPTTVFGPPGLNTPLVGPVAGALSETISPSAQQPIISDPQTARDIVLRDIQAKEIKEFQKESRAFGVLIESIPIIGNKISTWSNNLISTPSGDVNDLVKGINKIDERASKLASSSTSGILDPQTATKQIFEMQEKIARMEQRIKLLSLQSPELRANAEQLKNIEESILTTKQNLQAALDKIAFGITGQATDGSVALQSP